MKDIVIALFALGLLGAFVGGCSPAEEPAAAVSSPASIPADPSDLGTEKAGDHFAIKLSTDPSEPKIGKIKFIVEITHHGEPTEGAKVRVQPEMPGMEMDVAEIELKSAGGGKYEGTGDLRMAGKWQAKVFVSQDGHTGTETFRFTIKE